MQVSTNLVLDLQRPNINAIVHAKQNDKASRSVVAKLMSGESAFMPPNGANYMIRYGKSDGTGGMYDKIEDGETAAVTVSQNTATIRLAEQALTAPGPVVMELNIYDSTGAKLTTFSWIVFVEESAFSDEEIVSTNYFNILTEEIALAVQAGNVAQQALDTVPEAAQTATQALADIQALAETIVGSVGIDDTATRTTTTWSSQKIDGELGELRDDLVNPARLKDAQISGNIIAMAEDWLEIGYRYIIDSVTGKIKQYAAAGYVGFIIKVEPDTDYAFTYARYVHLLDSDKQTPIGGQLQRLTTVNSGSASYIAISFVEASYPRESYVFCKGVTATDAPISVQYPWLDVDPQITAYMQQSNVLYGKTWYVVGDSFSNSSFSADDPAQPSDYLTNGRYAGKLKLYQYFIGNRNNMDVRHFAEGGRTMTTPQEISKHNCFSDTGTTNNYTQIGVDADYITIWLGINDSKTEPGEVSVGDTPLGTIDDETIHTFYGAWNVVLRYLITHHPYAKIGAIVTNGASSLSGTDYPDAIRAVCRKWGVAYLDLNADYTVPLMHRVNGKSEVCAEAQQLRKNAFWQSIAHNNGHPNSKAHEYQSTFIEHFLRSL